MRYENLNDAILSFQVSLAEKKEAKVVAVAEAFLEVSALEAKKVGKEAVMEEEAMVPQPQNRHTAPLKMTNLLMEAVVEGAF